jgi:hypothetical protein
MAKKSKELYTDRDKKNTIPNLKFATPADARAGVKKIKSSGKSKTHRQQAALAMSNRAKVAGKMEQSKIYKTYVDSLKENALRSLIRGILISEGSRIVPQSMSMKEWESYKKKNKTTAKKYDSDRKTKWKITHGPGHKNAGKVIKGNSGLTYKKAMSIQNAFGGW